MKTYLLLLLPIISCQIGCQGPIRRLGSVGLRDYYSIRERSIAGPNITKMVSINRYHPEDERDEATASGPSLAQAGLNVVGSGVQGVAGQAARRPSTYKTTIDNSSRNEQFQQQEP